jgi:MYXO-CTERM domain-containing protein
MKRLLLAAAALSLPLVACSASTDRSDEKVLMNSQSIQGGQADPDDVNVLGLYMQNGWQGGMCTGTLIAPNLVLTARHCISGLTPDLKGQVQCAVSKFTTPYSGSKVYASTDMQLSQQSSYTQGADIRVPGESDSACGYDVALVILAQNMDITPRVPRIDIEPQAGEPYTAIGYGAQSDTAQWTAGTRMKLEGLTVQCSPGTCPSAYGVQSTEFLGDTGICSGDSGGPAVDADGKVIGVVSRGLQGCTAPTYGALTPWHDWIMQVAVEAAAKGGYQPPFWALSGKSDPDEPPPVGTGGEGGGSGSAQGQACSATQGCPTGFSCLADSTADQGTCTAQCDASNPCAGGLECNADLNVCIAAQAPDGNASSSGSSGGCSVSGGSERGPVKPVPWIVGALGLAFGILRRRRPR